MDSLSSIEQIKSALEDKKAENISIINVHELTSVCDYMIVASGSSTVQIRALANHVVDEAKKQKIEVLGIEGEENREWILIDLGNIIVHIMLPEVRTYYELEKLWSVEST